MDFDCDYIQDLKDKEEDKTVDTEIVDKLLEMLRIHREMMDVLSQRIDLVRQEVKLLRK